MRETRRVRRTRQPFGAGLSAVALGGALLALVAGTTPAVGADEPASPDRVTIVQTKPDDRPGGLSNYLTLMSIPSSDTGYLPDDYHPPKVDGPRACPPVRCRDYTVPLPPDVKVSSSRVRVLLPTGYHLAKNRARRYPVIHAYNGARSTYTRWTTDTDLTKITAGLQAIFVMSDGGINDEAGMFSDWLDGSFDWETFHTDVLIRWVDRRFRTSGANGTLGASMGGLGAVIYVARHPDVFQSLFTISGAVDTNMMSANILPPELAKSLGLRPPDLRRVWGNPVLRQDIWQAHNPVSLAPQLKGKQVLIASGTGYENTATATGESLHSGSTEQLLWTGHRSFLASLTAAGVPYQAWVRQGGVHNWPWFQSPLRWGLPKMVARLRALR